MKVVGLTGGIGCGKSTVAGIFASLGAPVIDADQVAREVVSPGMPAWSELVAHFGTSILKPDRSIDRGRLAALAFAGPDETRILNDITHPRIIESIRERLVSLRSEGRYSVVVLEAPLLFETEASDLADLTVVVHASPEICLARLESSGRISRRDAETRLRRQMDPALKEERADYVVDNGGSLESTRRQVERIWASLMEVPPPGGGPD